MYDKTRYPVLIAEILEEKEVPPSTLLFDTKRETGYLVSGLASRLCKNFKGRLSLEEAINLWSEETMSLEADYLSELDVFLKNLEEQGLLEWLEKPLVD